MGGVGVRVGVGVGAWPWAWLAARISGGDASCSQHTMALLAQGTPTPCVVFLFCFFTYAARAPSVGASSFGALRRWEESSR